MEHHHRVAWNEAPRIAPLELERERLLQPEVRIRDALAHFQIVLERHFRDGVGVGFAPRVKFREHACPGTRSQDEAPSRQASNSRQSSKQQFMPWP